MKILSFLFFLILLSGCGAFMKNSQIVDSTTTEINDQEVRLKASISKIPETSDPFTIINAKINGNDLQLEVQYGGGCKDHSFDCIGDEAIMKSNPPKRIVKLVHKNNMDECKALITKKIVIDIRSLAVTENKGSEIVLLLQGWEGELRYVFD